MPIFRAINITFGVAITLLMLIQHSWAIGYVNHKVDTMIFDALQTNGEEYAYRQLAYSSHRINGTTGEGIVGLTITNDTRDGDTFGFVVFFLNEANTVYAFLNMQHGVNGKRSISVEHQVKIPYQFLPRINRYGILLYRLDKREDGFPLPGFGAENAELATNPAANYLVERGFKLASGAVAL